MAGPVRAGALVYAKDLARVSKFYEEVLQMRRVLDDADHHVLESPDLQLIVHAIPAHIAATIAIESPPEPREEAAIKLFFTVASFADASAVAASLGGMLYEQEWAGPGFKVRNGCDPEGNILQLRERAG
jgi:predicted enzyme related to lactoylglutathione lyase